MDDHHRLKEDAQARERALQPDVSFIVEAPAGAGKTELLTQRFLALLATAREVEEVVALTFTLKAVAEMRRRILESLQRATDDEPPTEPHKRTTWTLARQVLVRDALQGWQLLQHPARLQVMTLDALCSGLARQMPVLTRLGRQPGIADDPSPLYRAAAQATLDLMESTEPGEAPLATAVQRMLRHLDNSAPRFLGLVEQMLAGRDGWAAQGTEPLSRKALDSAIARLVQEQLARTASVWTPARQAPFIALGHLVGEACAQRLAVGESIPEAVGLVAALDGWSTPLSDDPAELPRWRALATLLLTQKNELRSKAPSLPGLDTPTGKAMWKGVKDALTECDEAGLAPDLARVLDLPEPALPEADWELVQDLLLVLRVAQAQLWLVFQQAREVDFPQVAHSALQALGASDAPSDLQLNLDHQLRHLLVDEFQDTSPTQVELLRRLTAGWQAGDGRTVFLVGDPMQSIYRFRRAEVGLFLQVRDAGLGDIRPEPLRLHRNNRSVPGIVGWVNQAFAQVMPAADDSRAGAVALRPAAATRPDSTGASAPAVTVHAQVLDRDCDGEADAAPAEEAQQVLALIRQAQREHPGGSVAVLVRARPHLAGLLEALRRQDPKVGEPIRVQAVELEPLAGRQVIEDLLALTRALLHRGDRLHWLAVLRAPWCGLTLADLHVLAGDDHGATVVSLLRDEARVARLSDDGQRRLRATRDTLLEALAQQGRLPPRRWIEATWRQLGGPACLGWELAMPVKSDLLAPTSVSPSGQAALSDALAYFEALERCEDRGSLDLDQLNRELERLYANPGAVPEGAVQLMTIHKAKGLEFDTVIVPGLHRIPPRAESSLLAWESWTDADGTRHQVVAPLPAVVDGEEATEAPPLHRWLQLQERGRQQHEAQRLLYVAATRARERLHLLGTAPLDAKGEPRPPAGSFLALLWPVVSRAYAMAAQGKFVGVDDDNPPAFETVSSAETADTETAGTDGDGAAPALRAAASPAEPQATEPWLVRLAQPQPPTIWQSPIFTAVPTQKQAAHEPSTAAAAGESPATDPLLSDAGRLVHRVLERIALEGLDAWPVQRVNSLTDDWAAWLRALGHAEKPAASQATECAAGVVRVLQDERLRWVLAAQEDAHSEWALSIGSITERLASAEQASGSPAGSDRDAAGDLDAGHQVLDRSFVRGGERWIVDFKLGMAALPNSGGPWTAWPAHAAQLRRYAALFKAEGRPLRLAVLYLGSGCLAEVDLTEARPQ